MKIQHNIAALNSYRNLSGNNNQVAKNLEKLSSGYKINRAGDDAAGLAISEKMRSQISGLNMAVKNANDGISLIQTAEGALTEVHSMLQRANELAVQSANGVNSESERESIQNEFLELTKEIDRIADGTSFNKIKLLDGSLKRGDQAINVAGIMKNITVYNLSASNGGTIGEVTLLAEQDLDSEDTTKTVNATPEKIGGVTNTEGVTEDFIDVLQQQIVPNAVASIMTTFDDTFGYLEGAKIGIGLNFIDDSSNGASAFVAARVESDGQGNQSLSFNLTINLDGCRTMIENIGDEGNRNKLEAIIAHEMTHALMFEAHTAGMIGIDSNWNEATAFPKWFSEGVAQTMGGAMDDWVPGIGITADTDEGQIKAILSDSRNSLESGTASSQYATGYLAVMYLGDLIGVDGSQAKSGDLSSTKIADGVDKLLNKVKEGYSLDQAIDILTAGKDKHYSGVMDFQNNFANDAAGFVAKLANDAVGGRGSLAKGKGLDATDLLGDGEDNSSKPNFKLDTTAKAIKNTYEPGYQVVSGGTLARAGKSPGVGSDAKQPGDAQDRLAVEKAFIQGKGLKLQIGETSEQSVILNIGNMHAEALNLNNVDLSTEEGAGAGVNTIKAAIDTVSKQRGALGAMQNRLEHTINNLSNAHENMTAAESRIRDVDMAKEMMAYTKNNILVQAAQAMLAQSNQIPQGVLQMLQ